MPIDPNIPKDNDLISTFPAAIREARQVVADYASGDTPLEGITVEHPIGSGTFITAEELACMSGVASNIQDQIDGKDPAGTAAGLVSTHASSSDHDGRYYTETEVNTLLSGKADVTQLHNAVTVTDTTSINLTLTGQALSADAVFGTTSGTVAQGSDSRFVTNGDLHDHAGGDGAAISLTSAVSGILPISNGGTGSSTQNFVDLTTNQTIAGNKTFTDTTTVPDLKALQVTSPARASIRPSLLLNFANSKMLDPRITFTRASTATYFDAHGVIRTAEVNQPRFDHDPVTGACKGLLIEEARTNLLTYSEEFDNAAWPKARATISANATVAPDGTLSADKLIVDSTLAATHYVYKNNVVVTASVVYTASLYCKAAELQNVAIFLSEGASSLAVVKGYFDLSAGAATAGVISGTGVLSDLGIEDVGGGWYRCWLSGSIGAYTTLDVSFYLADAVDNVLDGDNTSGIYIWGAQLEAGSFPTSYIPTTSAAVTRALDSASMTGANFSSWYRQDEGTFVVDGGSPYGATAGIASTRYLTCSDGTANERILLYGASVTMISGAVTVGLAGTGNDLLTYKKRAYGIKLNDGYFASGTVLSSDTTFSLAVGVNQMQIGCNSPITSTTFLNGHIARIAYYPKRLTNAELQGLSTP